jgi:hypothetical protein
LAPPKSPLSIAPRSNLIPDHKHDRKSDLNDAEDCFSFNYYGRFGILADFAGPIARWFDAGSDFSKG